VGKYSSVTLIDELVRSLVRGGCHHRWNHMLVSLGNATAHNVIVVTASGRIVLASGTLAGTINPSTRQTAFSLLKKILRPF
jgi:hypothetical protein